MKLYFQLLHFMAIHSSKLRQPSEAHQKKETLLLT